MGMLDDDNYTPRFTPKERPRRIYEDENRSELSKMGEREIPR